MYVERCQSFVQDSRSRRRHRMAKDGFAKRRTLRFTSLDDAGAGGDNVTCRTNVQFTGWLCTTVHVSDVWGQSSRH